MPTRATAIICSVRNHGETGTIVRALTAKHGLIAGYVRGGRSRVMWPVLIPSNVVDATWKFRGGAQLASLSVELIQSRAPLMAEPLAAAALDWLRHLPLQPCRRGILIRSFTWCLTACLPRLKPLRLRAAGVRRWRGMSNCCWSRLVTVMGWRPPRCRQVGIKHCRCSRPMAAGSSAICLVDARSM